MNKKEIIEKVKDHIRENLDIEPTGHGWWHSWRVWQYSKKIAKKEGGDLFVIELAALLHDIADWKFYKGKIKKGVDKAENLLKELGVREKTIKRVCSIVQNISFKGAGVESEIETKEGKIVQDADRLDAMGAIGIARAFATGQKFKQPLYDPNVKPGIITEKEYEKQYTGERKNTTINHFYEKLLLLKDRMNTKTGKRLAEKRHKFMKEFLERFFQEWRGKG